MVRGESAAGLGCKGGFGDLISVLNDRSCTKHGVSALKDPPDFAHLGTGKKGGRGERGPT